MIVSARIAAQSNSGDRHAASWQRGVLNFTPGPRSVLGVPARSRGRRTPTHAHGREVLRTCHCIADSSSCGAQFAGREGQQLSTATPLTSAGLLCLRTPRSVLRHAWTTATLPRVRREVVIYPASCDSSWPIGDIHGHLRSVNRREDSSPQGQEPQARGCLARGGSGGQGRGRTVDLPIFRRT